MQSVGSTEGGGQGGGAKTGLTRTGALNFCRFPPLHSPPPRTWSHNTRMRSGSKRTDSSTCTSPALAVRWTLHRIPPNA